MSNRPAHGEGALVDVLLRAGVALDQPVRGGDLASVVRVTVDDDYQVVFALSDLDPTGAAGGPAKRRAARRGRPLPVAGAGDRRPARWVRHVSLVEIVDGASATRP